MNYLEYAKANPKLVQAKESVRYPGLFVLKYKRNVFYDNLWNDQLVELRGRVVDAYGNTVISPFTKIFNRHENDTEIDRDEECLVIDKINGFMAAMTYVPSVDKVVISTTGSLDSEFVDLAEKHIGRPCIRDYIAKMYTNGWTGTWLFEIVDETDPHIISEEEGAYLIGYRPHSMENYFSKPSTEGELDNVAIAMRVMRPWWSVEKFGNVTHTIKTYNREGVVVYGLHSGTSLKIKTPFYLMTKFLGRMGINRMETLLENRARFIDTVKDEEFFPLVDYLIEWRDTFLRFEPQDRIEFIRDFISLDK